MKKVLLTLFLVAISLGACVLLYFIYHLSYGLIVLPVGESAALELAKSVDLQLLWWTLGVLSIFGILSFFILKKGLRTKRSGIMAASLAILMAGVGLPGFLQARHHFLEYQRGGQTFNDFHPIIDVESMEVRALANDSAVVFQKNDLLRDLKNATYKRGAWKYMKTHRMIIQHSGHIDTFYTNGLLIGPVGNRYFEAAESLKEKYGW